ncbi:hypothetical protein HYC85_029587 [Camellia sinensis]|uniref:BED-type domain-containing protein n=1 Tax=Camellia sinensis TaxID=4442 RepID=A0A7J7G2E5_CAMSI|nr:hypothetical protein HYC85_029587 [Camellia sinensis]
MDIVNEDANDVDNLIELEEDVRENGVPEDNNPFQKKTRKRTSKVWNEIKKVVLSDGTKKAECMHCKTRFAIPLMGATTHLLRHSNNCARRQLVEKKQKVLSLETTGSDSVTNVAAFKYDQAKVREATSHMILYHEYPFMKIDHVLFNKFMKTATPRWQKITCTTAKNDCVPTYDIEKKKFKILSKIVNRISITTNLWKSGKKIQYMVVTGPFIDIDWKLQNCVLNFCNVPPLHTGVNIMNALYKCLVEWDIENKLGSACLQPYSEAPSVKPPNSERSSCSIYSFGSNSSGSTSSCLKGINMSSVTCAAANALSQPCLKSRFSNSRASSTYFSIANNSPSPNALAATDYACSVTILATRSSALRFSRSAFASFKAASKRFSLSLVA